jgi:hypothetical protein
MGSRVGNSKGIFTPPETCHSHCGGLYPKCSGIEVEKVGNSSFLATPYSLFPIPFLVNFPHFFSMRVFALVAEVGYRLNCFKRLNNS